MPLTRQEASGRRKDQSSEIKNDLDK